MSFLGSGNFPDAKVPPRTRTEELRLQLADEIINGAIPPGMALYEAEIAERFGVSRTPVREVIRMLAASGLVDASPNRTAIVAKIDGARLAEMFEVMANLEALCANLSAQRMTLPQRQALEKLHEELRILIQNGDPQEYHEKNEAFHNCIYAGSQNTYLAEVTLATRTRVQPFRRAQFRNLGRLEKSYTEHDRIVNAILRGARDDAAASMRSHILTVYDEYEIYSDSY